MLKLLVILGLANALAQVWVVLTNLLIKNARKFKIL